ncbi:MAG: redoxin domain-containing protein [Bacteroidales bacterium]|nr:redoxin domain-containing protein [Bacteroidales bacterium]
MKKLVLIASIVLLAASCAGNGNKNELKMDVQLTGAPDSVDVIVVEYGSTAVDRKRQPLQDGRLAMTLPLEKPVSVTLQVPGDYYHFGIGFPGVPGESVVVRGSFEDYTIGGSRFYKDFSSISDLLKPGYTQMGQMRVDIEELFAELTKDREKNADRIREESQKYSAAVEEVYNDLREKARDYVEAHPDQEAVVGLLPMVGTDKVEDLVAVLSPKVVDGRMKPALEAIRKTAENERIRKEAEENVKEGAAAPDFTLNDINGKLFTLSSLRGKYVVLDFWGSWCGWCIKGIPDMKKYYEKYAGKFEIVGIDCRDTQEKWKAAVEKYELPWLHVYNAGTDGTPEKYAVQGYPTKILIDPEGKIEKIFVGESEKFYEYLDELFG